MGVRFWPGAAFSLLAPSAARFVNRSSPLAGIHSELAAGLAESGRDLEDWSAPVACLSMVLAPHTATWRLDRDVLNAVSAIQKSKGRATIRSLVESSGLSERQFQRRFLRATGLTAKELSRVRRVRAAAIEVLEADTAFSDVAFGGGFSDQAHLIREFRDLIGPSPRIFRGNIRGVRHGRYAR